MFTKLFVTLCAACAVLSVHARSLAQHDLLEPGSTRALKTKHMFNPAPGDSHFTGEEDDTTLVFNKDAEKGCVLMLHDHKERGANFMQKTTSLISKLDDVKFVFPTAPSLKGAPSWFDVQATDHRRDPSSLIGAARIVKDLIDDEVNRGTPANKIIIAGFGQGGAVALSMLHFLEGMKSRSVTAVPAGIIGISSFVPLEDDPEVITESMKKVPVFMMHGTEDNLVQKNWTLSGYEALENAGANIGRIEYTDLGHELVADMMGDVGDMIREMLFASDNDMQLLLSRRAETVESVSADGVEPLTLEDLTPLAPLSAESVSPMTAEDLAPLAAEDLSKDGLAPASAEDIASRGSKIMKETSTSASSIPGDDLAPLSAEDLEPLAPSSGEYVAGGPAAAGPISDVDVSPMTAPAGAKLQKLSAFASTGDRSFFVDEELAPFSAEEPSSAMGPADAYGPVGAMAPTAGAVFCKASEECEPFGLICHFGECSEKVEDEEKCADNDECVSGHCQFELKWQIPESKCAPKKESGESCLRNEVCVSNKCEWDWDIKAPKQCK